MTDIPRQDPMERLSAAEPHGAGGDLLTNVDFELPPDQGDLLKNVEIEPDAEARSSCNDARL